MAKTKKKSKFVSFLNAHGSDVYIIPEKVVEVATVNGVGFTAITLVLNKKQISSVHVTESPKYVMKVLNKALSA